MKDPNNCVLIFTYTYSGSTLTFSWRPQHTLAVPGRTVSRTCVFLKVTCPSCCGPSWRTASRCPPKTGGLRPRPWQCWSVPPGFPAGSQRAGGWSSAASPGRTWRPAAAPGSQWSVGPSGRRSPLTPSPLPSACSAGGLGWLANTCSFPAPLWALWWVWPLSCLAECTFYKTKEDKARFSFADTVPFLLWDWTEEPWPQKPFRADPALPWPGGLVCCHCNSYLKQEFCSS